MGNFGNIIDLRSLREKKIYVKNKDLNLNIKKNDCDISDDSRGRQSFQKKTQVGSGVGRVWKSSHVLAGYILNESLLLKQNLKTFYQRFIEDFTLSYHKIV